MSGDLDKIKICCKCFIEAWQVAVMKGLLKYVMLLWTSNEACPKANTCWSLMLAVGRRFNTTRTQKRCQITKEKRILHKTGAMWAL